MIHAIPHVVSAPINSLHVPTTYNIFTGATHKVTLKSLPGQTTQPKSKFFINKHFDF